MFVVCSCGATNSAFNPACVSCGRAIEEDSGRKSSTALFGPGSDVGGYVLREQLGAGSLGRVFHATAPDGTSVAIKVLHPHMLGSDDARVRFLREARALKDVRHPHIARLLDAFEHEGLPVLKLELVRGRSLRRYLDEEGPMDPDMARVVLEQLTEALGALHGAGWLHRDIKPENVILVSESAGALETRLLDFGLARSLEVTGGSQTAEGTFVGSLAYAAPEQVLGDKVGPAADWWALGVLAYELLTNARPFRGDRRLAIVRSILWTPPPEIKGPPDIARTIRALLVKDSQKRPTYAEIRSSWRG